MALLCNITAILIYRLLIFYQSINSGNQWEYSGTTVGVEEPHNNHVFKDNMLEIFVSFKFRLLLQSKCW